MSTPTWSPASPARATASATTRSTTPTSPAPLPTCSPPVAAITGERPAFFRAPYGVFSDAVVARAREARLRPLGWAVDTEDFAQPTPTTLVPQIIDAVVPGAVILFHDGGGDRRRTVDALPYVITALRRQGYRFVLPGIEHPPSAERAAAPA